jgi:hypothetical protein
VEQRDGRKNGMLQARRCWQSFAGCLNNNRLPLWPVAGADDWTGSPQVWLLESSP